MLYSEEGVKWCLCYIDLVLHYLLFKNKLLPMLLEVHQDLWSEEYSTCWKSSGLEWVFLVVLGVFFSGMDNIWVQLLQLINNLH